MGLFSMLFDSDKHSGGEPHVKVREKNSDRAVQRGDRYTSTSEGKHMHDGYNLDTASGGYREYTGGENSGDRGYNR